MPNCNDPKIPISKDMRKRLNIYKVNKDFKSYEETIKHLLEKSKRCKCQKE